MIGTWTDFTYNIALVLIWGLAESAITIVAASIPFLRMLVREVSSGYASRGKYTGNSYQLQHQSHGPSSGTRSKVKADPGIYETEIGRNDDTGSDKSILGDKDAQTAGQIVQTQEVRVEYGDSSDEASLRDNKLEAGTAR